MLRIHCMLQWYSLGDGSVEDVLYEMGSIRLFIKLFLDQAIHDRTTIINFRHLLELQSAGPSAFRCRNQWLSDAGSMMKQGAGRCHSH